jgi:O-antigen/teichoic acid export membrane protein
MAERERPTSLRQWVFHFLVYGLAVVGLNALSFIVIPIYTRRISPAEYGILELLNRGQDVLAITVMSGMSLAALAFYQFEAANPGRQRRVFSTALLGILGNGLVLLLLLLPFAKEISGALFRTEQYAWAIYFVLPLIPLEMVFSLGLVSLQSRYKSVAYITLSIGRFVIGLSLNLIMVLWLEWGLKGILIATAIHTSVPAIATFLLIMRRSDWQVEWKLWKELLRYGLPFVPGGLFLFVLNSGDRYLLNLFHGQGTVGLYAISYKLGSIATFLLMSPFLKVWGPVMINVANGENGPAKIARLMTHVVTAYVYVGMLLSLLAPAILRTLVSSQYQGAAIAVPIVTLAYLFWDMSIIADTVFYATKKTNVKPFILGLSALLCLSFYLILIPPYGILGAAWATVIAFAFFALFSMRVGRRYMQIPYELGKMTAIILFGVVMFIAGKLLAGQSMNDVLFGLAAGIFFPTVLWLSPLWNGAEKATLLAPLRAFGNRARAMLGSAP